MRSRGTIPSMAEPPIYLDYHATTPVDPRVVEVIVRHLTDIFGNASSVDHAFGDAAEAAVAVARAEVGRLLGAPAARVIFTSGATESINLAVQGFVAARTKGGRARLVVSPVEHSAVLESCREMARRGVAELVELHVDERGRLDLGEVERVCAGGADLICVMAANNEIGNVYPISEIGAIAQRSGTAFLCDATQAAGRVPFALEESGITYLALSAHKMYGPKGVGALVIQGAPRLRRFAFGGGQENGLRPGTLNVPGIAGLGEACRLRRLEMGQDEHATREKRDRLQAMLSTAVPDLVVNGDPDSRLAGNLHVSVLGVPNQAVIARVRGQLAIATGSACSSGIEAPSHVLRSMSLPAPVIDGALRISLGKFTTEADVDGAADLLTRAIESTRNALRLNHPLVLRS